MRVIASFGMYGDDAVPRSTESAGTAILRPHRQGSDVPAWLAATDAVAPHSQETEKLISSSPGPLHRTLDLVGSLAYASRVQS